VSIRLYLNPVLGRSEMPLKRFYRYSIASEPSFDDAGLEVSPSVRFEGIPQTTLLTLAMDTPGSWQAFPKQSVHDLDNIRLSDLKPSARTKGVDALFELSNIIVEGHARESKTGMPPRGLQIVLSKNEESYNTLVMANLGYHQLKANPGVWNFTIREGRSSEVFELQSLAMTGNDSNNTIAVTSFEGVTVFPRLGRLPGMEGVDLLDEEALDTGSAKQKAAEALYGLKNR
jgi:UDP-glucose:glycoprotein glucosyltransferase